jgi:endonuclease III
VQAPIIPPVAMDAWQALADALADHGRVPCQASDPGIWWPERRDSPDDALAMCQRCHVRAACPAYALAAGQRRGIWGGMTPAERKALSVREAA